jgi:hypothetical protein
MLSLPQKPDSNLYFTNSVLVFGREKRPLLPEPRVTNLSRAQAEPEHTLSRP